MKSISIYGFVGTAVTAIDFLLFLTMNCAFELSVVVANLLSWIVTLPIAYLLHSKFSFRQAPTASGLLGFGVVSLTTLFIATVVVGIVSTLAPAAVAKLAAIVLTFAVGFCLSRSFVFRSIAARC